MTTKAASVLEIDYWMDALIRDTLHVRWHMQQAANATEPHDQDMWLKCADQWLACVNIDREQIRAMAGK